MFWNDTIFVILALKNRGDTNKPDRKTIIVQITTASVVVKGDLNKKIYNYFQIQNIAYVSFSTNISQPNKITRHT